MLCHTVGIYQFLQLNLERCPVCFQSLLFQHGRRLYLLMWAKYKLSHKEWTVKKRPNLDAFVKRLYSGLLSKQRKINKKAKKQHKFEEKHQTWVQNKTIIIMIIKYLYSALQITQRFTNQILTYEGLEPELSMSK